MTKEKIILQDIEEFIDGQNLLELAKMLERLHYKYSSKYEFVWLDGFNIIGYNKIKND